MVEQETGIIFDRDAGDIIQDPDFLRSRLPQPYRMINKLLNHIIELTWNNIVHIEKKKQRLKNRFKSPECHFSAMIQPFCNVTTISSILEDENGFIVVGLADGLAISRFKDKYRTNYAFWHEEGTVIEIISVMRFKKCDEYFYIATSDIKGIIRMFCFARNTLFFICQLKEQEPKVKVVDLKLSSCCEYLAFALRQAEETTEKYFLELYSLPSIEWISTMKSHTTETKFEPDPTKYQSLNDLKKNVVHELTFSSSKLLMRQEQPFAPSVPSSVNIDDILNHHETQWVPGLGRQTLLTQSAIKSRWNHLAQSEKQKLNFVESFEKANAFKRTFRDSGYGMCKSESGKERRFGGGEVETKIKMAEWLKLIERAPPTKPAFHFIGSDKSKKLMTRQLMVTWRYQADVYYYNLESVKKQSSACPDPDILWPTPSDIVASDSSRSAMILVSRGNTVIIWNGKLGILKNVFKIEDEGDVRDAILIDKSSQRRDDQRTSTEIDGSGMSFWVVALSTSGYIYVHDIEQMERPSNRTPINPFIENNGEVPRNIHKLPGLKNTFGIVQSDGRIFLYDVIDNKNTCEITMPCSVRAELSSLTSLFDGDERYLLVIGRHEEEEDINEKCGRVETKEKTSESPLVVLGVARKKTERKTGGDEKHEENDSKMTPGGSQVSGNSSCVFVFKVSDFTASQKFFTREKILQCVGVSTSSISQTLLANKDILERIHRQDCLNERLVKKWKERRETFNNTVIS